MATMVPISKRCGDEARCYFAFPLIEEDLDEDGFDEWMGFANLVAEAKAGHFENIPPLLATYDSDAHWIRRLRYVHLLGDAAPDAVLERVHAFLSNGLPLDYARQCAQMLLRWGRLDAIPTIIRGWRTTHNYEDAEFIPPRLVLLLEEGPGPFEDYPIDGTDAEAEAYQKLVLDRHAQLSETLGEKAFVFRGRRLDVEWIARRALEDITDPDPSRWTQSGMRHKFEAMTGIDCSSFYHNGRYQPLSAAVLLEAFLAGPGPSQFVPGQRYFFGHRVPAGNPADAALWPPR